ncbi:type VI secretion system-associated FHA domain protein TagH [Tahibacter sp. UC22_41]|uniref:type VI secretion system-associated FHA domain protein TagH n=1 Tax=Tahibacter sp. UC22_41 TaxID=3350178 RepID=UPI0036DA6B15
MSAVRLELVVLSYNGQALAAPLSRALDTPVSIGRGSDNDLPLNDPERLISRHQARLCLGPAGTVDISNLSSSSSLFINGSELAPGRSCTMSPSDQLLVGRYVIGLRPATLPAAPALTLPPAPPPLPMPPAVNDGAAMHAAMPSAMPSVATPAAANAPGVMPASVAAPASSMPAPAMPAAATSAAAPVAKPAPPRPTPVPPAAPMATRSKPAQTIPDDFDVFAIPAPPTSPYSLPVEDVSIEDYSEKAAVREVFSELQAIGSDVIAEPAEEARQRSRLLDTNRNSLDPLEMLSGNGDDIGASASLDHGLEIDSLFVLPSLVSDNGMPGAAASAPAANPAPMPMPPPNAATPAPAAAMPAATGSVAAAERMMADLLGSGPLLDPSNAITTFDDLPILDAPSHTVTAAPPVAAAAMPPAAAASIPSQVSPSYATPPAPMPVAPPLPQQPPAAAAARAPVAATPSPQATAPLAAAPATAPSPVAAAVPPAVASNAGNVDHDTAAILRAAFARGCGIDVNHVGEFTPLAMEMLGRIVAAMTAGTIRLMHGRSSTKHEMRANVTIIATDGNNPLKFAPDGTAALTQLLGRGSPGFMPPLRAIEDAFDDLSAHQVGLLAGSRAAMYDVASMLGPERFLARAGEKTGLETVMPAKHKARLWDLYENGYQEMVGEAREEFENLFQRAFARAYEQEIDRINTGNSR